MVEDNSAAAVGDPRLLAAGYERLRSAVLAGSGGGWRLGHGVLSARGTAAWIDTFGSLLAGMTTTATATRTVSPASASPPASAPASGGDSGQVVAVLCQMVLPLAA